MASSSLNVAFSTRAQKSGPMRPGWTFAQPPLPCSSSTFERSSAQAATASPYLSSMRAAIASLIRPAADGTLPALTPIAIEPARWTAIEINDPSVGASATLTRRNNAWASEATDALTSCESVAAITTWHEPISIGPEYSRLSIVSSPLSAASDNSAETFGATTLTTAPEALSASAFRVPTGPPPTTSAEIFSPLSEIGSAVRGTVLCSAQRRETLRRAPLRSRTSRWTSVRRGALATHEADVRARERQCTPMHQVPRRAAA